MADSSSWSSTDGGGPAIGVVIVSFNTGPLLDRCLTALRAALTAEGLLTASSVWVVDNASPDGSADMVARRHPWVQLVALAHNAGFTAGNNLVLSRWAGEAGQRPQRILLLNPDTEITSGALGHLVAALDGHSDVAVVGPQLRYPDGTFQHAAFRFPGVIQTWLDLVPVPRLLDSQLNGRYPRARYGTGVPFAVDFVLGACMLVRGEALAEVGPLDVGYYMYCEEIDWCQRFRAAGWRTLCVPAAVVVHQGGASTGQFREAMFVQLWRSRRRYFARHAGRGQRWAVGLTLRAGLTVRAVRDRWAVLRGRLTADERDRRASAYRRAMAGEAG